MDRSVYYTDTSAGGYTEISHVTAGFLRKRKLGEWLPDNPYMWRRYDHKFPRDFYGHKDELYVVDPFYFFSDGRITDHQNFSEKFFDRRSVGVGILTNKLMTKVRNKQVDLGVALGEYAETAAMIATIGAKIAKAISAARKGRFGDAMRALTGSSRRDTWKHVPLAAANTWLGVTYGLKPLLNDIYGAMELLEKRYTSPPVRQSVRASHQVNVSAEADISLGDAPWIVHNTRGLIISGRVSGIIHYQVDNPVIRLLDQVGLLNPAAIAWELVPYSFVVDWFLPVGDFFNSVVPPQGVTFLSGVVSENYRGTGYTRRYVYQPDTPWTVSSDSRGQLKERTLLTAFPSFYVKPANTSLGASRVMSAISLITQAVFGGKTKR